VAFRRARQHTDSAVRLIETGYACLNAFQTCPRWRWESITRQLMLMPRWLDLAHELIGRALRRLEEANEGMIGDPRDVGDAPARIELEADRLSETCTRLGQLSDDTEVVFDRMERVLDAAWAEAEALRVQAEPPDELPTIEVPKPHWRRTFLRHRRRCMSDRLRSLRRRRRSSLRVADAPRRVCRGRAPPAWSICQL
jgi:hypothetical protein